MLPVETLQLLQSTAVEASKATVTIDGVVYSAAALKDPRAKDPEPTTLEVSTLTSLVDYLVTNRDLLPVNETLVHIVSPTEVAVLSKLHGRFQQRFRFLSAKSPSRLGGFAFGQYQTLEVLIIALQSVFTDAGDRSKVLHLLGTVRDEAVKTNQDDGVSQTVTAKAGIAVVADVKVPNPVTLSPFRTFGEIEQPSSPFVFRMKKNDGGTIGAAFFEADGGAWRAVATESIRAFLATKLSSDLAVLG